MAKRKKINRRIKKPKYLSLRLQFPGEKAVVDKSIDHISIPVPTSVATDGDYNQQEEEVDGVDDDNMEYLLSSSDGGGATTTLTGLLLDSDAVPVPVCSSDVDELSPSASVSLSYVSDQAMNLVRTALRSRERESSINNEERYVRYSEVVNDDQRRRDHEEVTSSRAGGGGGGGGDYHQYHNQTASATRLRRLSLKLDYEEIINAWSDKGGFYVDHSDLPQTVPDINHHPIFCPPAISNVGGLWGVPEFNGWPEAPMLKIEEGEEVVEGVGVGVPHDEDHHHHQAAAEEEWKWKAAAGQREASVLRYKEKKRNRLFSKTIRYQVRKENAQKRPRFKGRFVKRS